MLRRFSLLLTVWLCTLGGNTLAGEVMLIVNAVNPLGCLSQLQVRTIFTMRTHVWPNNQKLRVFVLRDNHPVHRDFTLEIMGLYPYQMRQYWDREVFSGKGQAPTEVETEEDMVKAVASDPGAIGYIGDKTLLNAKVRLLRSDIRGDR